MNDYRFTIYGVWRLSVTNELKAKIKKKNHYDMDKWFRWYLTRLIKTVVSNQLLYMTNYVLIYINGNI